MTKHHLSKKQTEVIEELFTGDSNQQEILQKHNVSRTLFNKWLTDESFKAHIHRRIEWLNLKSQALIARYASLAAAKLVALTDSEKAETARKASLDILSLPRLFEKKPELPSQTQNENPQENQLSPETAAKLLDALAKK